MPVVKNSLFLVVQRFPNRKESVRKLFRESESFRSLCDDFSSCSEALERWNRSSSPEVPQLREEYKDLLQELEKEIVECLRAV